jgi:YVTN family beta-propeller protein
MAGVRNEPVYRRRRIAALGVILSLGLITAGILSLAASGARRPKGGPARQVHHQPVSHQTPAPSGGRPAGVYAGITNPKGFSPAVAGDRELVYVPNTLSGTVSVIDPATYRVIKTISLGGQPHHVTPSWDLRHLYVDNPGTNPDNPGPGVLQVIDPHTSHLTGSIKVASPYNLYFTPDGTTAIVVAEYDNLIEFRNPHTWALIRRLHIPFRGVDHMDFSADGRYLLVSCEYTGVVLRISVTKMTITGFVHVGGLPIDVKVSPDGKVFFVANQGLGGVSIIDPLRMRKIGFIRTGVGAHGFAVSRNARDLYVSNRLAGSISVISFRTQKVVATWHVGGTPDMLQVSPNGKQLWASNRYGDTVAVISTTTGRVIHLITVGRGPHGLCFFPEPGQYSLGHNGVYR